MKIQIKDCKFIENSAKDSGGAIFIMLQLPMIDSGNIFKRNKAYYGENIASFPIRMRLSVHKEDKTLLFNSTTKNSSLYLIKNQYPGIDLNLFLKIEILDHFNQKINNLQNELFFIKLLNLFPKKKRIFFLEIWSNIDKNLNQSQNVPKLLGQTTAHSQNGVILFQNFSISAFPNTKNFLFIYSPCIHFSNSITLLPSEKYISNVYYYIIQVILSQCPPGSIMENRQGTIFCTRCEKGKFALGIYDICKDCATGGICENGIIYPKKGYYY